MEQHSSAEIAIVTDDDLYGLFEVSFSLLPSPPPPPLPPPPQLRALNLLPERDSTGIHDLYSSTGFPADKCRR